MTALFAALLVGQASLAHANVVPTFTVGQSCFPASYSSPLQAVPARNSSPLQAVPARNSSPLQAVPARNSSPLQLALASGPTPVPHPSQTPPPDVAATPAPAAPRYGGLLLDLERGYVVFSTGDALRMAKDAQIVDDRTGAPPAYAIEPGLYAIAVVDLSSGLVTSLRLGHTPLPGATPVAEVPRTLVAEASSPKPNPDLAPAVSKYHSKLSSAVQVAVTVSVPADTPFAADIYMATDTSSWNAQAIKMQRVDGRDFRIVLQLQAGTDFHYLFTRGTWSTVERERSGLQRQARDLFVNGSDALDIAAKVYRWADLP